MFGDCLNIKTNMNTLQFSAFITLGTVFTIGAIVGAVFVDLHLLQGHYPQDCHHHIISRTECTWINIVCPDPYDIYDPACINEEVKSHIITYSMSMVINNISYSCTYETPCPSGFTPSNKCYLEDGCPTTSPRWNPSVGIWCITFLVVIPIIVTVQWLISYRIVNMIRCGGQISTPS